MSRCITTHKLMLLRVALASGLLFGNIARASEDADLLADLGLRESPIPVREIKTWQRPKKIVVLIDSPARLAWFRQAIKGSDVELIGAYNPSEFLSRIKNADGVEGICTPEVVKADPELHWIQMQTAGVEECLSIPRVDSGDIILTNMRGVDAPNVAEHTFALLLALSRHLAIFMAAQQRATWTPRLAQDMVDLRGSTMLIVGLGANGAAIANRARAFDMHVIATSNSGSSRVTDVDYVGKPDELARLIGRADVVVNAAPLTPKTARLFNAALFEKMKRGAFFINVGRGKSVDTVDLVQALNSGQVAGAGLDVVDSEPLPPDDPLWKTPNVIITPHVANQSPLRMQRFWAVMRENLRRYVLGDRLLSVVDPARGY
jgi:phosphoglycerate dehydrogenase-like enzyme